MKLSLLQISAVVAFSTFGCQQAPLQAPVAEAGLTQDKPGALTYSSKQVNSTTLHRQSWHISASGWMQTFTGQRTVYTVPNGMVLIMTEIVGSGMHPSINGVPYGKLKAYQPANPKMGVMTGVYLVAGSGPWQFGPGETLRFGIGYGYWFASGYLVPEDQMTGASCVMASSVTSQSGIRSWAMPAGRSYTVPAGMVLVVTEIDAVGGYPLQINGKTYGAPGGVSFTNALGGTTGSSGTGPWQFGPGETLSTYAPGASYAHLSGYLVPEDQMMGANSRCGAPK